MPRLTWDSVGSRYYEAGVDRGVLYVDGQGVAWSGLISVDESPSGGSARAFYLDGVKYLNLSSSEEFEATINAFYSPPEFDACDGALAIASGLFATNQPRKPFGLCYRTLIGNDTDGTYHSYKIHLIYNALAVPTQRSNKTLAGNIEAATLSWGISTKPLLIPGAAPSAHLVVDTSKAYPQVVAILEDILYGSESANPRIPSPEELFDIFANNSPFEVTDNGDGTFTVTGTDQGVMMLDESTFQLTAGTITTPDEVSFTISSQAI